METAADQLAIDGPSPKMEQFLRKSYGVERLMRQSNNFAVSPQFFANCADIRLVASKGSLHLAVLCLFLKLVTFQNLVS